MKKSHKPLRFSLIELLVVIVIIAILAGMLLPALGKARNKAKLISCTSSLKQMGAVTAMYLQDSGEYFPAVDLPSPAVNKTYIEQIVPAKETANRKLFEHGCPGTTPKNGYYSYGYNYNGLKQTLTPVAMVRVSRIRKPSLTIVFMDAVNVANTFNIYYWDAANMIGATRPPAHSGVFANVNWVDGRASTEKLNSLYYNRWAGDGYLFRAIK